MATNSPIEWTEATWNPVVGCTVLSPGCTNCYAMRLAARLEAMGQLKYRGVTCKSGGRAKWNGRINLDRASLDIPKRWKIGKTIFVNSMSDLFHEDVPLEFIQEVFATMVDTLIIRTRSSQKGRSESRNSPHHCHGPTTYGLGSALRMLTMWIASTVFAERTQQ